RHPVNRKEYVIVLSYVRVEAAVVLRLGGSAWIDRVVVSEIADAIQSAAHARTSGATAVGQVLFSQTSFQRRPYIQPVRCRVAVPAFGQTDLRAGLGDQAAGGHPFPWIGQIFCRNAPGCRSRGIERRGCVPPLRR